jgi:REP element-mobilizing transposase RayT
MSPNTPPRIQGFSYRGPLRCFITFCARERHTPFAERSVASWLCAQITPFFEEHGFIVLAYCVMPDHVHLLLEGVDERADVVEAVRLWKQLTGFAWKRWTGTQLWQKSFHDRVLRDSDDTRGVVRYVLENPIRAGLVGGVRDYPWVGSSRYTLDELLEHAGDWKPSWK